MTSGGEPGQIIWKGIRMNAITKKIWLIAWLVCLILQVFLVARCGSPSPPSHLTAEKAPGRSTIPLSDAERAGCIMNSSICELPCWEGIIPGKTRFEDTLSLLRKSQLVDPSSIWVDDRGGLVVGSEATIYWQNRGFELADDTWSEIGSNLAIVRGNIVDSIQLLIASSACSLSVG